MPSSSINPFGSTARSDRAVDRRTHDARKHEDQQRLEARRPEIERVNNYFPEIRSQLKEYTKEEDTFVKTIRTLEDQAVEAERDLRDHYEKVTKLAAKGKQDEKIKQLRIEQEAKQTKAAQLREEIAARREERASRETLSEMVDWAIDDLIEY